MRKCIFCDMTFQIFFGGDTPEPHLPGGGRLTGRGVEGDPLPDTPPLRGRLLGSQQLVQLHDGYPGTDTELPRCGSPSHRNSTVGLVPEY